MTMTTWRRQNVRQAMVPGILGAASLIVLSFVNTGSGLVSRDVKALNEFPVAGVDGDGVDASATISGDKIVVRADALKATKNVRFGGHNTANPNLMNREGLPASPFHTDGCQGATGE